MRGASRRVTPARLALLCALPFALGACAGGPVRAIRVDRTTAWRQLTQSAITTGDLSLPTRDVLQERGLLETFEATPEIVIAELHRAMVREDGRPRLLLTLAEMSFVHGERAAKPEYHMAAAIYAYAFLFPGTDALRPGPFDPRFRLAADLYNASVTAAFKSKDGAEFVPRGGAFALPIGSITVAFDPAALRVGDRELHQFIPASELIVTGLAMRYRRSGIGAPLAAATRTIDDAPSLPGDLLGPRARVPLAALLRVDDARRSLVEGRPFTATLELHLDWDEDATRIAGEVVPLTSEPTAAMALSFNDLPVTEIELFGFLGRLTGFKRQSLVSTTPYRRGMIPVVFVHGTGSSVVRWAEMFNRLEGDDDIREAYQFWFFQYDSNNPIALSALQLRDRLTAAVAHLDPEGKDPALRRMVLIGHSQGGLLVKMQAIHAGDLIWNNVSKKPLDQLKLSDETRDLFRRGLFVEPLPEVSRVVFISTPHRGSFVAASRIIANLTRWLTSIPLQVTGVMADLARNADAAKTPFVPTAVDNMSPGHPFIKALQSIPVAPTITAHSIISVIGEGPPEPLDDGVVKYTSAHIDGVESELVVRSPHSCQGNPNTMEEVRRILLEHLQESPKVTHK